MDTNKKESKELKRYGWAFCEHDIIERFCPKCKYNIPAIYRKDDEKFWQAEKRQAELQFNS